MTRISRDEMFGIIVHVISERGTCLRKKVGALIVREGRILVTGYVGSPPGMPHCLDEGCLIGPDGGCIRTTHAEANAVSFAAKHGISLDGADMYCTTQPCLACAKLILSSGIRRFVAYGDYRDPTGVELLTEAAIIVERLEWKLPGE